ncbi:LysR substrate-binding domain-containing protein [Aliiroseovarius sp. 2305UL8-7]|uniref:LysR substrate-binding domain-containing protein n=1 Tax=Aliiroseovarius conchicola TaxID=3121637 RepID=UPI003529A47A
MTHPLRLRQLEALMVVTHHGSMTRGAQELGISQPAVSRLLSDLREVLGFNLFNRRDGRLVPTQEVRYLLPDIRRVLEMMDQITEVSQNITDKKAGHLSIACLPGFATSHLPGVVAGFLKNRPGVSVTLEPDRPERILEWMVGEQFDFGITDGFEGHPAVESEHVDVRTVCVFPTGHQLGRLDQVSPQDLTDENIIHTRRDSTFFRDLNEAFQKEQVALNSLVETRQFTAACELVCNGVGVSVVSELDAAKYSGRGLDYRPFTPSVAHRLSLVRPILKQPSMITLEFMETFLASLAPFRMDQA